MHDFTLTSSVASNLIIAFNSIHILTPYYTKDTNKLSAYTNNLYNIKMVQTHKYN